MTSWPCAESRMAVGQPRYPSPPRTRIFMNSPSSRELLPDVVGKDPWTQQELFDFLLGNLRLVGRVVNLRHRLEPVRWIDIFIRLAQGGQHDQIRGEVEGAAYLLVGVELFPEFFPRTRAGLPNLDRLPPPPGPRPGPPDTST